MCLTWSKTAKAGFLATAKVGFLSAMLLCSYGEISKIMIAQLSVSVLMHYVEYKFNDHDDISPGQKIVCEDTIHAGGYTQASGEFFFFVLFY